jgi:hypothetical protein
MPKAESSRQNEGHLIADYRLQITDCRLPIADYRLQITDCRLPIADFRLQILDCRF